MCTAGFLPSGSTSMLLHSAGAVAGPRYGVNTGNDIPMITELGVQLFVISSKVESISESCQRCFGFDGGNRLKTYEASGSVSRRLRLTTKLKNYQS